MEGYDAFIFDVIFNRWTKKQHVHGLLDLNSFVLLVGIPLAGIKIPARFMSLKRASC